MPSIADTESVAKLHLVPEYPEPDGSPYTEWGRLTQFVRSARLAFARERNLWASVRLDNQEQVRITVPDEQRPIALHHHMDALDNAELLHATVLVHSYALVESAAAERLATPQRKIGKIEDWGTRLLATNDRDWSRVKGGRAGAVEVAVVRNVFAHGARSMDAKARERLTKAGVPARPVGSTMTLTYDELREYRTRLLSLLNVSGIGR